MQECGRIELIVGGMFSGKSEELIRRLKRAKIAGQGVIAIKHSSDKRYSVTNIVSHAENSIEALTASSIEELENIIETLMKTAKVVNKSEELVIGIDEAQFFGEGIVALCEKLANSGARVIVAGLDMDFRGEPFSPMDKLLARAEKVQKLNAICAVCKGEASRSQRLINGEPAKYTDPIILVGASETYEARCRKCHCIA